MNILGGFSHKTGLFQWCHFYTFFFSKVKVQNGTVVFRLLKLKKNAYI